MKTFEQYLSEAKLKTLYIHRNLLNPEPFIEWAKAQGFTKTLDPKDLHCTQMYSSKPVDWSEMGDSFDSIKASGGKRKVIPLGDAGAVVLKFENSDLNNRWKDLMDKGCSWDYPSYMSHVSITYDGKGIDLNNMEPYDGDLKFGPEVFQVIDTSWSDKVKEKKHSD